MYFIYTLSIDGIIFYIGMSQRPDVRYRAHHIDGISAVYYITRTCNYLGRLCELNIIDCAIDERKARVLEDSHIYQYSKKYFLMNRTMICTANYYRRNEGIDFAMMQVESLNNELINKEIKNIKQKMLEYGQK